jgi:hypothetical protein
MPGEIMNQQRSILADRTQSPRSLPVLGTIRPGTKKPTKMAAGNAQAAKIYAEGVASRTKMSVIEKQITDVTGIKNPLFPHNPQWFTVAAGDFPTDPTIAEKILALYGEDRGDGRKLYSFPVVFNDDLDLEKIMPHGYSAFKDLNGRRRRSKFDPDKGLRCMTLPEIKVVAETAKRSPRVPPRTEIDDGPCEHSVCPHWQARRCTFVARLLFSIPGIPGMHPIRLPTSSEYAGEEMYISLMHIINTVGRIPTMLKVGTREVPVFSITKKQVERAVVDDDGKEMFARQWVSTLHANVDLSQLRARIQDRQFGGALGFVSPTASTGLVAASVPLTTIGHSPVVEDGTPMLGLLSMCLTRCSRMR